MSKEKCAVIGSGSWGTALASLLADRGFSTKVWGIERHVLEEINRQHTNAHYLPGIVLPDRLIAVEQIEEALDGVDLVVLSVPSQAVRENVRRIGGLLKRDAIIVNTGKGFELASHKRLSEVIREELPSPLRRRVAVLSGPSHAEEVARKMLTAIVVAAEDEAVTDRVQDMFMTDYFRVYANRDIIGVEICAALKNIIALCVGMIDGLGFGDNTRAAVMTRGITEIARLGDVMGACTATFFGLAGVGDLIVTCTSKHSRNYRAGFALGQGKSLETVLSSMGMVVEGVSATKIAAELALEYGVELPIIQSCHGVLFEGMDPHDAAKALMAREKRMESDFHCKTD